VRLKLEELRDRHVRRHTEKAQPEIQQMSADEENAFVCCLFSQLAQSGAAELTNNPV
jgi:hypothetical protein